MSVNSFPWCLTSPIGKVLGISGQNSPVSLTNIVDNGVQLTIGDTIINRILTHNFYDIQLRKIANYLLDNTVSANLSITGDAIITTNNFFAKATNPSGISGFHLYQGIANESWNDISALNIVGGTNNIYSANIFWGVQKTDNFISYSTGINNLRTASLSGLQALMNRAATPFISINGSSLTGSAYIFSYYSPNNSTIVRNTGCWLGNTLGASGTFIDTTARAWFSPNNYGPNTLITPYHIVYANHYNGLLASGTQMAFIDNSGNLVTGTVATSVRLINSTGYQTDINISTFISPIPSKITPFKLMPSGWARTYFGAGLLGNGVPAISLFQVGLPQISFGMLSNWQTFVGATGNAGYDICNFSPTGIYTEFWTSALNGDSSSPLLIYNPSQNEFALIGIYGFPNQASDITDSISLIQMVFDADFAANRMPTHYIFGTGINDASHNYVPFTNLSAYPTYNP